MRQGWKEITLGEIGKPLMCKRILKHQTSPIGDIPFYKIGTFGKTPDAFISKEIYNEFRTNYSFPKKGDILISAAGTIGRRVRYDGEPAFFQDSNIVWIDNGEQQVLNDYLYVFYEFCDWQPSKGATISRLYNSDLTSIKIAFPKSIKEQQRIVSILDEAFTAIATAKANAEQNLKNAKELFECYLQSVFGSKGEGWEEKTIGEVCTFKGGGTPSTKVKKYWEGDIPWVSPKDMKSKIIFDSQDHITMEAIKSSAASIIPSGSILIVVRSGILVRIVPLGITTKDLAINQDLKALCPSKKVNLQYLFYFLQGNMKLLLSKVSRGATVHRLTTDSLRELSIGIPSLITQQTIVQKLDALSNATKKLEAIYQTKINDLEELKKSVLQKAFSGELKTAKAVAV